MRSGSRMMGILSLACALAASVPALGAGQDTAAPLLGHRLVTLAYNRSRSSALPGGVAVREAEAFLEAAQRVDPENVHTLKLLVEAASAAGDAPTEREALRSLIRQDPGDLVAQVRYIDFLAAATQAIDERARTFQGALDATALDPQIRSEMAVRLANIALERADTADAKGYLRQALQLNDVNMEALWANVRIAAAEARARGGRPAEYLQALVALLNANPLQPDAWVEMSRLLAGAGLPSRAADELSAALEQFHLAGEQASAELYLEWALDLATAGRRVEAYPTLAALAKLPDSPVSVLVAAQLLANEYTPPATQSAGKATTQAATQAAPGSDALSEKIRTKLAASIKADPKSAQTLTDAVWVELTAVPTPAPETEQWINTLRAMVPPEDPVLTRLEGWRLLRAGKLEEARGILEKAAPADPLAQLGLARVLIAEHKTPAAAREIQGLWWSHPTGVFAFQVAQTARMVGGLGLTETQSTQELLPILQELPSTADQAHLEPRDLQLVTAVFTQRSFALDEPVVLQVRINNTTQRAVPVGPDGLIKTTIGLSALSYGIDGQNLGVYAIENLQRVYRLEPRAAVEATVRADQGAVAELLNSNPRQTFTLGVSMMTAPRGAIQNAAPGLGGQVVPIGDFERRGYPVATADDIKKLTDAVGGTNGREQAVQVQLLCVAADLLSDETEQKNSQQDEPADAKQARTSLRGQVTAALAPVLKSPSAVMRAWVVLNLPLHGLDEVQDTLLEMHSDGDPVVRLAWGWKMSEFVRDGGSAAQEARGDLVAQAAAEKDPMTRRGLQAIVQDLRQAMAATKPARK